MSNGKFRRLIVPQIEAILTTVAVITTVSLFLRLIFARDSGSRYTADVEGFIRNRFMFQICDVWTLKLAVELLAVQLILGSIHDKSISAENVRALLLV